MDDEARRAWGDDPAGYASARLAGDEARMVAGLDPVGLEAMAHSHLAKKDRFDYFHRLHHEHLDREAGLTPTHTHTDGNTHTHTHADGTTHSHEEHR